MSKAHPRRHKPQGGSSTIRNIPAFVKSYLGSDSGKNALNRKPFRMRDKDTGEYRMVWRNPAIAVAFQDAVA